MITSLKKKSFQKQICYRLIPSKFPPIELFEDVASNDEFNAVYDIQRMTNPRIQDDIGNISLVPNDERVFNTAGSGYIMAAFTHVNPDGSRFSNGDYGIYYAAEAIDTAIAETMYHSQQFLNYTNEPAQVIDMRCLVAQFDTELYDVTTIKFSHDLYSKTNYAHSQHLGAEIKVKKGNGIVYNSVRKQGINFALLKPRLITNCQQGSHYGYIWDGEKISTVYKKVVEEIELVT